MISKNAIKRINSLQQKKFRNQHGVFIAEGVRLVNEILDSNLKVSEIYYTQEWNNANFDKAKLYFEVLPDEMKKISSLTTPSPVLAIVSIPNYTLNDIDILNNLTLALDTIQDPGNMGTILRLADWFGIDNILCSTDTVDVFSPKVVQSSMGAITRVKVIYCDLTLELTKLQGKVPIYGTFMDGSNIYETNLKSKGILIMGNEGNGISAEVEKLITQKINIPSFAKDRTNVESLNVAMATAIVCSEFKRRLQ